MEIERPLKVVRVIDRLIYGGPTRNVVFLTEGLGRHGFDCHLVTGVPAEGEGDMTFWANEYGVQPIKVEEMSRELGPRDLYVLWKLFLLFRKLRPDIVHTHKSKAGAAGRLAASLYKWFSPSILRFEPRKLRVVHTFHGHIFHGYYSPLKSQVFVGIERALARLTDCIVTVSAQQVDEIQNVFKVGRNTAFRVVPLGIDLRPSMGNKVFRQENRVADGEILFASVGRLCEVKNFTLMLQALARALQENPDLNVKLAIVGDGHLRPQLEKCVRDLGLQDRVIFTGFRSDVDSIYPVVDVAALSSVNEGTPLTLIEAMSHGRPVLTTEVGGYKDILGDIVRASDGFTIWDHGISVPSGDLEGYAAALVFLALNPLLREQMGERARRYAFNKFSRERLVSDTADLYHELWSGAPIPHRTQSEQQKSTSAL